MLHTTPSYWAHIYGTRGLTRTGDVQLYMLTGFFCSVATAQELLQNLPCITVALHYGRIQHGVTAAATVTRQQALTAPPVAGCGSPQQALQSTDAIRALL